MSPKREKKTWKKWTEKKLWSKPLWIQTSRCSQQNGKLFLETLIFLIAKKANGLSFFFLFSCRRPNPSRNMRGECSGKKASESKWRKFYDKLFDISGPFSYDSSFWLIFFFSGFPRILHLIEAKAKYDGCFRWTKEIVKAK